MRTRHASLALQCVQHRMSLTGHAFFQRAARERSVRTDQFIEFVAIARTARHRAAAYLGLDALDRIGGEHRGQVFGAQHVLGHRAVERDGAAAAVGALAVVEE